MAGCTTRGLALLLLASTLGLAAPAPSNAPASCAPTTRAPSAYGLRLLVESLSLSLQTPKGWRVSSASVRDELVLLPAGDRTQPLVRVRHFRSARPARDRLADFRADLPSEESGLEFVSEETWTAGERTLSTVRAVHKEGAREHHVWITAVERAPRGEHVFWFAGKRQELERHWPAIQAAIASSCLPGEEPVEAPEVGGVTPVEEGWALEDPVTGLRVRAHPLGFAPVEGSFGRLDRTGACWVPKSDKAPRGARMSLVYRGIAPERSVQKLWESLQQRLRVLGVEGLDTERTRVAGLTAFRLEWTQVSGEERTRYAVCLFRYGDDLFRVDYAAPESWASSAARTRMLSSFFEGLSFRE